MLATNWELRFPEWRSLHPTFSILLYFRQLQKIHKFKKEKKAHLKNGEDQTFQGPWDKSFWFALFNGRYEGQEDFQNKYRFGNLVRKIGYRAPSSIIVPANASLSEFLLQIDELNVHDPRRFCKPLWGVFGRGATLRSSTYDTVEFLTYQTVDYLVQTFEEPQQDWRYILHRDARKVHLSGPPQWRLAIEKVRPVVVGDGLSTLSELYYRQIDVPIRYRQRYIQTVGVREGSRIPRLNERVVLLEAANMAQGAYPDVASGKVLETLDRFFLQFLADIESEIGFTLGSLAVDIGVTDTSIFEQAYNHRTVREAIVFYEYQLPCTLDIYSYSPKLLQFYKRTVDMHPLSLQKILCDLNKKIVHANFLRSMMLTGAVLEKTYKARR